MHLLNTTGVAPSEENVKNATLIAVNRTPYTVTYWGTCLDHFTTYLLQGYPRTVELYCSTLTWQSEAYGRPESCLAAQGPAQRKRIRYIERSSSRKELQGAWPNACTHQRQFDRLHPFLSFGEDAQAKCSSKTKINIGEVDGATVSMYLLQERNIRGAHLQNFRTGEINDFMTIRYFVYLTSCQTRIHQFAGVGIATNCC